MKKVKIMYAIVIFIFLVIIGHWPGATGVKDEWDKLMKWAQSKKKTKFIPM